MIQDTHQFRALELPVKHPVRHKLVTRLIVLDLDVFRLRVEHRVKQHFRYDVYCRSSCIRVE